MHFSFSREQAGRLLYSSGFMIALRCGVAAITGLLIALVSWNGRQAVRFTFPRLYFILTSRARALPRRQRIKRLKVLQESVGSFLEERDGEATWLLAGIERAILRDEVEAADEARLRVAVLPLP